MTMTAAIALAQAPATIGTAWLCVVSKTNPLVTVIMATHDAVTPLQVVNESNP